MWCVLPVVPRGLPARKQPTHSALFKIVFKSSLNRKYENTDKYACMCEAVWSTFSMYTDKA